MTNIDDLFNEWSKDSSMKLEELNLEIARIPTLHAKYLRILVHNNLLVKKTEAKYNQLKKIKWEYYNGDLNNPEDLERYKLEPILNKVPKSKIQLYMDGDQDLINTLLKKQMHQEIADACELILKELNSRTYQVRAYLDWKKTENGS